MEKTSTSFNMNPREIARTRNLLEMLLYIIIIFPSIMFCANVSLYTVATLSFLAFKSMSSSSLLKHGDTVIKKKECAISLVLFCRKGWTRLRWKLRKWSFSPISIF